MNNKKKQQQHTYCKAVRSPDNRVVDVSWNDLPAGVRACLALHAQNITYQNEYFPA